MKIGQPDSKPAIAPVATERKPPSSQAEAGRTSADASARVDLSATAAALTGDKSVETSFDTAKVERIAQAIRDGKFQVNADVIADKLIANAQDLIGKTGS